MSVKIEGMGVVEGGGTPTPGNIGLLFLFRPAGAVASVPLREALVRGPRHVHLATFFSWVLQNLGNLGNLAPSTRDSHVSERVFDMWGYV